MATTTATSTSTKRSGTLSAQNFHLHDGFVKAMPKGKMMTAVFGTMENHTSLPVTVVGFTSPDVMAKSYQLHEVVNGVMQEKKGGITIPANGKHMLKPGGDHLMFMGVTKPIEAGSKIAVTFKFSDGQTVTIKDIPVRSIGAGGESYGSGSKMNMKDMKKDAKQGMNMDSNKTSADKK